MNASRPQDAEREEYVPLEEGQWPQVGECVVPPAPLSREVDVYLRAEAWLGGCWDL